MQIRRATVQDVDDIHALISDFAEQDRMLFRSPSDIYKFLQSFLVAEEGGGQILGCCALEVIWADLAEIKSLAVSAECQGKGIGGGLVKAILAMARELSVPRIFALTLEPAFFERCGFHIEPKEVFPMKVWSDCARCPKQDHCDEVAMICEL